VNFYVNFYRFLKPVEILVDKQWDLVVQALIETLVATLVATLVETLVATPVKTLVNVREFVNKYEKCRILVP
jgi:ABC-type phosphate/phosphonate transport system permease subunit